MICKECGGEHFSAMGYGDMKCDDCGVVNYAESAEDFHKRLNIPYTPDDNEETK